MKRWWRNGGAALGMVALLACGDDAKDVDDPGGMDGSVTDTPGGDGDGDGDSTDTGDPDTSTDPGGDTTPPTTNQPPATADPVVCGDETCATVGPQAAAMGVSACCLEDDGGCGIQTSLSGNTGLPQGAPGGADATCPDLVVPGEADWVGCCTPEGQCGALDSGDDGLGCVDNMNFMQPEQSCTYDPDNTCQRLVEVNCDGAEDCPGDQVCCGRWQEGYRGFTCEDSCEAAEDADDGGGIWSEACHPGESCSVDGFSCLQNLDYLPDFLFRCRDTGEEPGSAGSPAAGEVNCGPQVCGRGEQCCLSEPGEPACVAGDTPCSCNPGVDDSNDGGMADDGGL